MGSRSRHSRCRGRRTQQPTRVPQPFGAFPNRWLGIKRTATSSRLRSFTTCSYRTYKYSYVTWGPLPVFSSSVHYCYYCYFQSGLVLIPFQSASSIFQNIQPEGLESSWQQTYALANHTSTAVQDADQIYDYSAIRPPTSRNVLPWI